MVNLNDAVYRMLNPTFAWTGGTNPAYAMNIDNFSAANCPLLRNHDRREVVTYKDWVSILAGNPSVTDTRPNRRSRCLALNDTPSYAYLKPWARTFGKCKGPGGKPLSEVKPLDEMFWYYDALDRQIANNIAYVVNASRVLAYSYTSSGWVYQYAEVGTTVSDNATIQPLVPGVYGACTMSYIANTGFNIVDDSGFIQGTFPFLRCYVGGGWFFQNSIFFVDTTVSILPWWGTDGYFQGIVFRITPPGYWQ